MTTILKAIVGSTAYGLDHLGSDIDRLGCYISPTKSLLGLTQPPETRVLKNPDYTEHEIGKLVKLLLKCNPTVTELLWLPENLYELRLLEGNQLLKRRNWFISAPYVKNAYFGYATAQFKRLLNREDGSFSSDTRKRTEKHARHLKRLLWQGYTLYSTGNLPIKVENPQEYFDFGEKVAKDSSFAQNELAKYEDLFKEKKPVINDLPDTKLVEQYLISIRKNHWDG